MLNPNQNHWHQSCRREALHRLCTVFLMIISMHAIRPCHGQDTSGSPPWSPHITWPWSQHSNEREGHILQNLQHLQRCRLNWILLKPYPEWPRRSKQQVECFGHLSASSSPFHELSNPWNFMSKGPGPMYPNLVSASKRYLRMAAGEVQRLNCLLERSWASSMTEAGLVTQFVQCRPYLGEDQCQKCSHGWRWMKATCGSRCEGG